MDDVILRAKLDGFETPVPRNAVADVKNMQIEEGEDGRPIVATRCSKGHPLLFLASFLRGEKNLDKDFRWNVQFAIEILQVADYYQLDKLIAIAVPMVKRFLISLEDARYVYNKIGNLHTSNTNAKIAEIFKIINRFCSTSVEFKAVNESVEINLVDVDHFFKKIVLVEIDTVPLKWAPITTRWYKPELELIKRYITGSEDVGQWNIHQKHVVLEASCLFGYDELFKALLVNLYPTVTPEMANDICNLLFEVDLQSPVDAFSRRLDEATSELEHLKWRSGEEIPLSLTHWIEKSSPEERDADSVCLLDDKDERRKVLLLNREKLFQRLEIYLSKNPVSKVVEEFAKKYPLIVKAFLRDESFLRETVLSYEALCHLLRLGDYFEYHTMYIEAYRALDSGHHRERFLRDSETSPPPTPEFMQSLVRLQANDGASYLIDPRILREETELFGQIEKYNEILGQPPMEGNLVIKMPYNSNKDSLAVLIQFLCKHNFSFLDKFKDSERTQILAEFLLSADYFGVDNIPDELFDNLMYLLDEDSAYNIYNVAALHHPRTTSHKLEPLKRKLEKSFLADIYYSPHFLRDSVFRFVVAATNFYSDEKLQDLIVQVWTDHNKERLQREIPMPQPEEVGDLTDFRTLRLSLTRLQLVYPELDKFLFLLEETYVF